MEKQPKLGRPKTTEELKKIVFPLRLKPKTIATIRKKAKTRGMPASIFAEFILENNL